MASNSQIRVMIVDGLTASRKNICNLLAPLPDVEVVGIARNGTEGIRVAKVLEPQVILMDPNFSDMDSLQTIQTLRAEVPTARIIMVSVISDTTYLQRASQAGVRGFLPQPPAVGKLIDMIREVSKR